MTEVPFAVAVIAAAAPIVAGAIPLIVSAFRDNRKDKRERAERMELERQRLMQERRKECAALLRMARDFQVLVENNYEYHGPDKVTRLWDIRQRSADITGRADEVGLLVPSLEAGAEALADAANSLVASAADGQSLMLQASTERPDVEGLSRCIAEFRTAARAELNDKAVILAASAVVR
jgi:hypothetical protein